MRWCQLSDAASYCSSVCLSTAAWQWQLDSDPYNVIAVYVLQLYELVLLCRELWEIQGRHNFFQMKIFPQSGFQVWHCTAQGQWDLNSQFMPQVGKISKAESLWCLFRACLVFLGRTRTVKCQQNGESSAILSLAFFAFKWNTSAFFCKQNMRTVSTLSGFVLQCFNSDWDLYGLLLIQFINRS